MREKVVADCSKDAVERESLTATEEQQAEFDRLAMEQRLTTEADRLAKGTTLRTLLVGAILANRARRVALAPFPAAPKPTLPAAQASAAYDQVKLLTEQMDAVLKQQNLLIALVTNELDEATEDVDSA